MPTGNREYRDRLFTFVFGNHEHLDWTLSLYNAVNETDYADPGAIELNTIEDVLYLGMHNDVSFIMGCEMNMYEQQSTYNPNMPLRMLQYASSLYGKHTASTSKYAERLIPLPVPRLMVFYNGARNVDDEQTLLLSDSFPAGSDPDIEVRVRMVNINEAHSSPLMQRCQPLREYAWTVGRIREKMVGRGNDARLAVINGVVESMPDSFLIKPYLIAHKGEVVDMLLTEYDEAREMELLRQAYKEQFMVEGREEGREEGRRAGLEEGREEGRIEGMVRMCQALGLTEAEAADRLAQALGISLELAEPKVRQHWQ